MQIPEDLARVVTRTLEDLVSPGNGWTGAEKAAIVTVARGGTTSSTSDLLPQAAVGATQAIAETHTRVTESWVHETVATIGETRYAELVGVTAVTACVDRLTTLLGMGIAALPQPRQGLPIPVIENPRLKRRSAWVSMSGPPGPRHAVSAAPRIQETVSRLLDRLYISESSLAEPGDVRGLTREQVEVVAVKVSHSNECFY